jgi:hypothetical protein
MAGGGISISDTAKLEAMIHSLTLLIKIGKYLPWIMLAFAVGNVILAILNFTWWNNIAIGVFDSILAFAAFVFFGQLMRRRKIHRYDYRYNGRHLRRTKEIEEEERFVRKRSKETTEAT